MLEHPFCEHAGDHRAGGRALGVHDAAARMAALEPEAVVERHAEIDEVGDARRRLAGEHLDGARPRQSPRPARKRVLGVQLGRVVVAHRGGDTALRQIAGRGQQRAFRQEHDVGVRGGAESPVHTGDPAADDDQPCSFARHRASFRP